jgi:hypothetical protein
MAQGQGGGASTRRAMATRTATGAMMSHLAFCFGCGAIAGVILFFMCERLGLLEKWFFGD